MGDSHSHNLDDLLALMARLRDPDSGCPWDLQQDARSIINHSLEEVYELADAIEQGDDAAMCDELGDLLFQVVFLARLAEERERFDFGAVVDNLCNKLIRRHPHVFPGGSLATASGAGPAGSEPGDAAGSHAPVDASEVAANWDRIKRREREQREQGGLFADVPLALPALLRARKLQKRAASIGLDWPDASGAMASLREEVEEVTREFERAGASARQALAAEMGDLLFSCVNVCRKLSLDPEQVLRDANRKFCRRAEHVEQGLVQSSQRAGAGPGERDDTGVSPARVDELWRAAKAMESDTPPGK